MITTEVDHQFRYYVAHFSNNADWYHIQFTREYEALAKLWTEILNDADFQQFLEQTLYIPWERPQKRHADFMLSILAHLAGMPGGAPVTINLYPDVVLTDATILHIDLADPSDGEMCLVTYRYHTPALQRSSVDVDCVYARLGNNWHPGAHIPCKYLKSNPSIHRLKELTPDH